MSPRVPCPAKQVPTLLDLRRSAVTTPTDDQIRLLSRLQQKQLASPTTIGEEAPLFWLQLYAAGLVMPGAIQKGQDALTWRLTSRGRAVVRARELREQATPSVVTKSDRCAAC